MDLSAEEIRVLGALVEKALATPQSYPLTLNSLRLACNQATNRQPVVDYGDQTVQAALTSLRARGLTRVVHSPSNRAAKYRHVVDEIWHLGTPELAVLCALALRGPQTLGELKTRTERLHAFGTLAEVEAALGRLATVEPDALATRLARQPGQKDARYAHLLGPVPTDTGSAGPAATSAPEPADSVPTGSVPTDSVAAGGLSPVGSVPAGSVSAGSAPAGSLVVELQQQVAALRQEVSDLRGELAALWELVGDA